jgi:hypothetical protein
MSNDTNGARRRTVHRLRVDWLRDRPDLLARLPGVADDVDGVQSLALVEALAGMVAARLYAPTSGRESARDGIRKLVSELRARG